MADDRTVRPLFYMRELEGGKMRERIKIEVPGDNKNVFDTWVTDEYRERFAEAYAKFKSGVLDTLDGTPLRECSLVSFTQEEQLRRVNCYTCEQLVGMADQFLQGAGMGARKLRDDVAAWLKTRGPGSDELAKENASLKVQIAALTDRLDALESRKGKAA